MKRTARSCSLFAAEKPERVIQEVTKLATLNLPARHQVLRDEINPENLHRILLKTYEAGPDNFEALLSIRGVGPKTLRALSLLSELVYGAAPSFRDPARYSYAHGGKDGHPYPVNREVYDSSIAFLKEVVNAAKIGEPEKKRSFERLGNFYTEVLNPP